MSLVKISIFTRIMQSFKLNCFNPLKDNSDLSLLDLSFRAQLYNNYDYISYFSFLIKDKKSGDIVRLYDAFNMYSFLIFLPEFYVSDFSYPILFIGPFLDRDSSFSFSETVLYENSIPESLFDEIKEYYNKLPILGSIQDTVSWIISLAENFFDIKFTLHSLDLSKNIKPDASLVINNTPYLAMTSIEERYALEEKFLNAISDGDFFKAFTMYSHFKRYKIEPRSSNIFMNQKYLLITLNSICRKSVQYKNKVHPYYLDELSKKIAIQIASAQSSKTLNEIERELVRKYCLLAKNHSLLHYSRLVGEIISYIELNYTDKLSLSFLAEHFHVSKPWLCSIFKKEIGMSITTFINKTRLDKSILLLNSTDLPIQVISQGVGFNDPNYFIRTFKKFYGKTPKQYKKDLLQ